MHNIVRGTCAIFLIFLIAAVCLHGRRLQGNSGAADAKTKIAYVGHAIIPAFERFHTAANAGKVRPGQLLLGELNCTSCHKPSEAQLAHLLPRQAPILTNAGKRLKHAYIRKFLASPHAVKPGTAMPDLFADMPKNERDEKIESLVHLLASTGSLRHEPLKHSLASTGRALYHQVGCVACHGSRNESGHTDKTTPSSVRLEDLAAKYTIPSLNAFLANPHQSRPAGRMPGILDGKEARQVAHYLLQDIPAPPPNLLFAYYEGNWSELPDFAKLKPKTAGKTNGFDLSIARRADNFALKFNGWLKIDRDGDYRFHLSSDDGSKLLISGKQIIDNDGEHAPQTKSGATRLTKGLHPLEVQFFEKGGGVELRLQIEGPGVRRQPAAPFLTWTNKPKVVKTPNKDDENITIKPELVAKGRKLFSSMGCASCHELKSGGKILPANLQAPALTALKASAGCVAATPPKNVPHFQLSPRQKETLNAAVTFLKNPPAQPDTETRIANALATFNCYACHERNKIGGPEDDLEKFFTTPTPEMGDEGRIPPKLDLVGAKLKTAYFQHILANGANDRPYMHTRMPRFGSANTGDLVELCAKADKLPAAKDVTFKASQREIKKSARFMVGGKAFGCIKCHTFAGHKAEGVQGIDMTLMTKRVKHDWFRQYLLTPEKFRPGTRMPTAWPGGKSFLDDQLGGDSHKQIEAIWVYLSAGKRAALPRGMIKAAMELIPVKDAIIYRNFITGAGSRAIAVGYPEQVNLAFDANNMRLALLWQGSFIDAAKHWTNRGQGYQKPLGENILQLPVGPSVGVLQNPNQPWPNQAPKELGFKFRGYRLTPDQRPTFLYAFKDVVIEDVPNPVNSKTDLSLKRTLTFTTNKPTENLYFRAAVAKKIEAKGNNWYVIDDGWKMRLAGNAQSQLRQVGGNTELLAPVRFQGKTARIEQEIVW